MFQESAKSLMEELGLKVLELNEGVKKLVSDSKGLVAVSVFIAFFFALIGFSFSIFSFVRSFSVQPSVWILGKTSFFTTLLIVFILGLIELYLAFYLIKTYKKLSLLKIRSSGP